MAENCSDGKRGLCTTEWNQTCWLIGIFVQKILIRVEGTRMKSTDELRRDNPMLSIADSINLHRELYGPRMEWDDRRVYVRYRGREFEIAEDAEQIAAKWSDDKEGFNMVRAFNEAVDIIVPKIAGEEASKRFQNLSAMEIVALG
jgi:hypothetical protein